MNTAESTVLEIGNSQASTSTWKDWMGIVASIGCAIHCAAMPFVIAYLPALGLSFLADEAFHKWMALVCFLIAIAAFVPGLRKHGNWIPVSVGAFGLAFITFAAFGLAGECCASCDLAKNELAGDAVVQTDCDQCACCATCSKDATDDSEEAKNVESVEDKGLLATIAPWVTPFGGMLLVVGHLLNRRYGCLCGCCGPKS